MCDGIARGYNCEACVGPCRCGVGERSVVVGNKTRRR